MDAHASLGLNDLLKSPSVLNSNSSSKLQLFSTTPSEVGAAKKFKDLTLDDEHISSSIISSSSSSLPSLIPSSPEKDLPRNLETKNPNETIMHNGSNNGRNLDKAKEEENEKKQSRTASKRYSIPPPISCRRHVKIGEPYFYLKFDEETDNYKVEEIKIPKRSLFRASRENGRLKLYLDLSDEE